MEPMNPSMMSATSALGKPAPMAAKPDSKKKKKKPHMKIRPIEDQQYIVENTPNPDEMEPSTGAGKMEKRTEHAKDLAGLHAHLDQFYGEMNEPQAEEKKEAAQPAPQQAVQEKREAVQVPMKK